METYSYTETIDEARILSTVLDYENCFNLTQKLRKYIKLKNRVYK